MHKKKIGIIGATGYTGSELVRILSNHPEVEIAVITSESRAGEKFSDVHPYLQGIADQKLHSVNQIADFDLDLIFLALPHGVSMEYVEKFSEQSFKIVDLSGDFRLDSQRSYEEWYKMKHSYPQGMKDAAFGIPELFAEEIKKAKIIANPGCFPTGAVLGAAPLLHHGITRAQPLIVDSKTGVTGAGIRAKPVNLYSNVNDNFKAYGLKKHRHTIEIQQTLNKLSQKETLIQFTPHLLPVDRGILSTIYAKPDKPVNSEEIKQLYTDFYKDAKFIRIRNEVPAIKEVRGSNYCDIYTTYDERTDMIIAVSAIDNLVRGAAGQAVQNMNLLFGMDEASGLQIIPVHP